MAYANAQELLAAISPATGGTEVLDPATGELVGRVAEKSVSDLDSAVAAARAAQPAWDALGHDERKRLLNAAADNIEANAEALAELLSREQGKPLNGPNARFEVGGAAAWLRAATAYDVDPEVVVDDGETYAAKHYRALGVVGAIGPWNWPMMISIWQLAPSLRMGNTVVMKPSEYTPLSVIALGHILNEVLPADVLHVVAGGREVGEKLSAHPDIDKIMFTGSTRTGKAIIRSSADTVKRLTLELGGNDAGVVMEDADPQAIAQDLFWGAFINTGQTCAALKRLYVPESIYDQVCSALTEVAKAMPMGVGLDENNVLGPLQNKAQYDIVADLVKDAVDSGATVLLGANPDDSAAGYFYPTTLISDIDPGNRLVTEEQFGPALPIIKVKDSAEAIKHANALEVGLGASVWGSDRAKALEVAAQLQAGTVWINSHGTIDPRIPFGGAKQSGYGLEFGLDGLKSLAQPQVIKG
ncbi:MULTISPECIES: aldehyde dehydrogenase family protein [Micrococcaceae]|uniref:Aldehyde dehydrogenase n=1 Tax=Glutamicibacter soli TaxID=453836 RepID=A0A365YDT5_9MICC|nr:MULTISPECIES: aldehyde dehydrogenase family protein [Micrococcaceae]ALQ29895.1 aldehyde dehydrogenase [Arthrobacter sp. YC-RL1]KLI88760.1 aldehyde dehydrogenase [Arthrobacter sp. YC-RL1]RBM00719.1 aldehyde dehydrogenase [Glutamicibacter soli]